MDMNRNVEEDMDTFEAMPMAKRVKRTREVVEEYRQISDGKRQWCHPYCSFGL